MSYAFDILSYPLVGHGEYPWGPARQGIEIARGWPAEHQRGNKLCAVFEIVERYQLRAFFSWEPYGGAFDGQVWLVVYRIEFDEAADAILFKMAYYV